MRRYVSSHLFFGPIFMISILLVAALALNLSKSANPQASQDQSATVPTVVNQTEALQVESLTKDDTDPHPKVKSYTLVLKNVSHRRLVAWVIKHPGGTVMCAECVISNGGFEPGESRSFQVYDDALNKPGPKQTIIALAMFEDGSSEGDFSTHESVTKHRAASKLQTERINEIFRAALQSRQNTKGQSFKPDKEWLQDIVSEISQLSETAPPETAPPSQPHVAMGLISAKRQALTLLKDLIEWEDVRHTDSLKANEILRQEGSLFGASDVQDGLLKIIRYNENLVRKNTFKGGDQ